MSCAFLGPAGSYTSQAASQLLPNHPLAPFPSIQEVYSANTPYAVLPIENTIHGVVQETLGCLLSDETRRWRVRGTLDMGIQHALVMSEGMEREDVRWVASHEQALGQCTAFLRDSFPNAKLVPVPSTAQAAHALHHLSRHPSSTPETDQTNIIPRDLHSLPGAAICSAELGERLPGLIVAQKGVQDVQDNYTRFLLLRRTHSDSPQPIPQTNEPTFYRATSASALQNLLRNPSIHLIAIHSRAYPRTSAKTNGNAIQQNAKIQAAQQAYMEKYNKRYLVEVVGEVGDDVPGLTKL